MSVFSDFQRLWVQRFPQSSLSDAWEQDVRASLERHRQRIVELKKDLEQETLYVEYLERLLSDVEKYKEAGGDPTSLFEAATTSQAAVAAAAVVQQQTTSVGGGDNNLTLGNESSHQDISGNIGDNKEMEESVLLRSTGEGKSISGKLERDSNRFSSFTTTTSSSSSPSTNQQRIGEEDGKENEQQQRILSAISSNGGSSTSESNDEHEDKDIGTEKDLKNIQIQKNGALNQCINELTSSFRGNNRDSKNLQINDEYSKDNKSIQSEELLITRNSSSNNNNNNNNHNNNNNNNCSSNVTATSSIIQENSSHFVTVIEVNETNNVTATTSEKLVSNASATSTSPLTSSSSFKKEEKHHQQNDKRQQSEENVTMIAASVSLNAAGNTDETVSAKTAGSLERKSDENNESEEPSAPPMSPSMSASTTSASSSSSLSNAPSTVHGAISTTTTTTTTSAATVTGMDAGKKKVPPRPPPKFIRRVEPPTVPGTTPLSVSGSGSPKRTTAEGNENTSNSLERNIKPSDILRQKSSESLDAKNFAANRKTTPEIGGRLTGKNIGISGVGAGGDFTEDFSRKVIGKSESLEKTKKTVINQSPTGSLGKATLGTGASPTSSLTKSSSGRHGLSDSPTGSLGKSTGNLKSPFNTSGSGGSNKHDNNSENVGSKESLASQGNISEIIKSYESISSLSSDSMKASQVLENEPYYDTVPVDNGDGEYVYIKPGGGTGSTSSRDDLSTAGSTLPMPVNHPKSHMSSQTSVLEPESPGRSSNYVNIEYFLHQSNETRSSSIDSDGELDAPPIMRTISHDEQTSQNTPGALRKISGGLRGTKIRSILNSIIQSETIYVECLNKMIQYKKAIHATLGTSQPVIKEDEENSMFFKIDELHAAHTEFLADLKNKINHYEKGGDIFVGDAFKRLADIIDLYSAFLHNYGQAIDTVKKCSASNPQFKKIVSTIVLKLQNEQSLTLEDLLHKPVARVQINALVFSDLLNETPPSHPDHQPLREAHKTIHIFLKQFNVVNQRLPGGETNKNLRRMVKNSFIVELVDGHRKLRHLFLFNDAIACAKYKASGRDKFEFELKWFIPLKDVQILEEDSSPDYKETSPANILQLKSQACTVRDQILMEEKDEKKIKANGLRLGDKHRRKLAELESQLVLASPNLVFKIKNKLTNKIMTFFLSSDFERSQWIDSIFSLQQQSCNIPGVNTINVFEIQAFVYAMQEKIKPEMGSYLMRNRDDESLLVGDLHLTVQGLTGLEHPADMYICIEVDSYGHYFRKAKTKMVCRSTSPLWNESFVLELEGSQNVRILLYETRERAVLKAKNILKLSRLWLQEMPINKAIKMSDAITLNTTIRFVPGEVTLRRVPTSKPGALFGAKMSQVLKREKRDIPFIISACIREVERRGMSEIGIYRVSGSASDLARLKKSFETNSYEAEQLLKEVDIHSVTGILKLYLRELPEALFTDLFYQEFFAAYNKTTHPDESSKIHALMTIFGKLPATNRATILHILDHLIRVYQQEGENKMSLHNLATVFGPTLLRPGQTNTKQKDLLASSTIDVMSQAGILYCFLQSRLRKD